MNLHLLQKRVVSQKVDLLLDLFPNAGAAFSLRKIRSDYSGFCVEVRRSSDNALQNIGFVNNEIDTVSLLAFVGAGDGFIRTWYDQSLNSRNALQINNNNQPRIVLSGVLITSNTKASLNLFDNSSSIGSFMEFDNWHINTDSVLIGISVYSLNNNFGSNPYIYTGKADTGIVSLHRSTTGEHRFGRVRVGGINVLNGPVITLNQLQIITDRSNRVRLNTFVNKNQIIDGADSINNTIMGTNYQIGSSVASSLIYDINISELIFYKESIDVDSINDEINSYYNIY